MQATTEYFKTIETESHPLVGTITCLGPVNYVNTRTTVIEHGKKTDLSAFILAEKGAKVRMFGTTFVRGSIDTFEEFSAAIEKSIFTKDERYADQSEWRLCIMGIVANQEGCGYISIDAQKPSLSFFTAENLAKHAIELIKQR